MALGELAGLKPAKRMREVFGDAMRFLILLQSEYLGSFQDQVGSLHIMPVGNMLGIPIPAF